jgi:hypothetical protein
MYLPIGFFEIEKKKEGKEKKRKEKKSGFLLYGRIP